MKTTIRTKLTLVALAFTILGACTSAPKEVPTKEISSQRSGDLVISLRSEKGELAQGQNQFILSFHSAKNEPVNAGTVTLSSSMAMPGMAPMTAPIELESAGTTGDYKIKGDFAMSGAWRFEVRWDGPAGQGTTSFSTNVR